MEDKLLKIINHYGVLPQLKYFQSEVFELNEAIISYENAEDSNKWNDYSNYDLDDCKKHIAEEIADVRVMLEQFIEYYNIDRELIAKIMNEKVDRQLKRIEEEK